MLMHIVIATGEAVLQKKLSRLLTQSDTIVEKVTDQKRFWKQVLRRDCDLIIVGGQFLVNHSAPAIRDLRQLPNAPAVVVLSDDRSAEEKAKLIAAGFVTVLSSSLPPRKICDALNTILERRRAAADATLSRTREPTDTQLKDFAANSPAMKKFIKIAHRVINSNANVLILGETGVGKERLAHALHAEGPRGKGPFVPIHCAALPESLLESELFGHEQGAFTGATRSRRGYFELAHDGTIFLDEIGEVPIHLQAKLLRVLEAHKIRRVGGEEAISVDVRVMAATNRDIEAEIEKKCFRKDLYYRLNVVSLTVPPLRERIEDIPELVESYINYLPPRIGCPVCGMSSEALDALCRYSWPGNVRELINIIERAMLLCEDGVITCSDLPPALNMVQVAEPPASAESTVFAGSLTDGLMSKGLKEVRKVFVEQLEQDYLTNLLRSTCGCIGEAARRADINERTLFEKMRRYGLNKKDFRQRLSSR